MSEAKPCAAEQPPVERAIQRIDTALEGLDKQTEGLEERLRCVLGESEPKNEPTNEARPECSCPLEGRLLMFDDTLHRIRNRLDSIRDRLCI